MASTHTGDAGITQTHQNDKPSRVKLIIHHQFPGVELISPVYASDGATCYLSPDQRVNVDSTTQVDFNIDLSQTKSIGILMYKLQRKDFDHANENTISNEATYIQFVVAWEVYESGVFYVYSCLIEHDKDRVWDRDNLIKLTERCKLYDIQYGPIEETWLMHDHTVLTISMNTTREEGCYKLEMTISEGSIKDDTQRIQYIDMDR
jgi:hypothetical protein